MGEAGSLRRRPIKTSRALIGALVFSAVAGAGGGFFLGANPDIQVFRGSGGRGTAEIISGRAIDWNIWNGEGDHLTKGPEKRLAIATVISPEKPLKLRTDSKADLLENSIRFLNPEDHVRVRRATTEDRPKKLI